MTKLQAITIGQLKDALSAVVVSDDVGAAGLIASGIFEHATEHQPKAEGERVYPPFEQMIHRLFKQMDTPVATLLHASIGMSGEAAELLNADSGKNIIEECGDLEFYIEAAKQHFTADYDGAMAETTDARVVDMRLSNIVPNIVTASGDFQDIVKKAWVYGKPLDRAVLTRMLMVLEINLRALYDILGTTTKEVQHENQVKLIGPGGRFESGFYSDAAAIARADKVEAPGADRNFIGKQA